MASTTRTQQEWKYSLPLQQYIHGKWYSSTGKDFITLHSAVDDAVITETLSCANVDDIDAAVTSAEQGLQAWQAIGLPARRDILLKFADIILENADRLGYLESIVVGKPITMGRDFEPHNVAEAFRYYAGFIDKVDGDLTISEDGYMRGVVHQPLGVCAAIIPFNSPLITFGMKVAPALAMGNTMIVKVSEFNPLSGLYLGELATQAGIPPGVLNIISGAAAAGQALSSHMRIRKISFTGSPIVGRKIQVAAAQSNLKRVTLELGGKSPVLIFDDADLSSAVDESMSFLAFNGQGCILGTRILVQDGIADDFIERLKQKVEGVASTLGADPLAATTFSSPLYHHQQRDTVLKFLSQGHNEATVVTGGGAWGDKGCYIQPTIFFKPKPGADIVQKEIFGPVVVVQTFSTEDEALRMANDTEYGLGAYVYTASIDRALRLSKTLEAGSVAVNAASPAHQTIPFGGWKGSGIGVENARYVLRAYTQPKSIVMRFKSST